MENLRRLQECNKRNTTLKKAFAKFGVTENDKPLKKMNEKEEFGALVNWALNQLPAYESMDLRNKVDDKMYQTRIRKKNRKIRIGKPKEKDNQEEAITYAWPEDATYETLAVNVITISMLRANVINDAKRKGQFLSEQEVTARVHPQIDWNVEELQMGENGENRVLTEEEMELINEFLQV